MNKRIFLLLIAAMLLSVNVSSQTNKNQAPKRAESEVSLKGDVNGDGKVDVEDVTSVVDLILSGKTYGYFYFGTTKPTADNYQTLLGVVASYTSIGDAIGATASIDAGETLYMLCPAAWMKGKKVVVEDGAGGSYNFIEDVDAETVPGYVIYRTEAWEEATDLTLNFEITGGDEYFWYVGAENPSSIGTIQSNPGLEGWREIGTSLDGWSFEVDNTNKIKFNDYPAKHSYYIVIPDSLHLYDGDDMLSEGRDFTSVSSFISGYNVWQYVEESANAKGFIIHE